jgi:hexokinase
MAIGIFSHFFALETTLAERQFFRALAKLIGRRAARLSACGIAAIVSKKGYLEDGCSVGADGSLYNVRVSVRGRQAGLMSRPEIPRIRGPRA